jgi:hypothetical protein
MTDTDRNDPNAPPFCPVCAVRMTEDDTGGAIYWTCPKHGRQPGGHHAADAPACETCGKPKTRQRTGTTSYWLCVRRDYDVVRKLMEDNPNALGTRLKVAQERIAALQDERDEAHQEQERLRGVATELAKDVHFAVRTMEAAGLMPGLIEESQQCANRLRPISGQYIDRVAELEAERDTIAVDKERMLAALVRLTRPNTALVHIYQIRMIVADALGVSVDELDKEIG